MRHRSAASRHLSLTLGVALAFLSLLPLMLMFWSSLKPSGTLFAPQRTQPVFIPPPANREIPGARGLEEGLRLTRGEETTWGNTTAHSVIIERESESDQGIWAIPGLFELQRVRNVVLHLRDASESTLPIEIGFEDTAGARLFLPDATDNGAIEISPPTASGWRTLTVHLDRVDLTGLDHRNVRRVLIRPLGSSIEMGPIRFDLKQFGLLNYTDILRAGRFHRYTLNSAIVALCVTLGNCLLCLLVAYAFARRQFRGKTLLWITVIGSLMIPVPTLLVPIYMLMRHIPLFGGNNWLGQGGSGWIDTYWVLIVPALVSPFGIFVMRQYLMGLPQDLEEAAEIDGASLLQTLRHVVFPLCKPALAVVAIVTFMGSWNNFIFPYLLTRSDEMRTLPVGLAMYNQQHVSDWGHLMAGSALAAIPVIIVFLIFQRFIIAGLTAGALKS